MTNTLDLDGLTIDELAARVDEFTAIAAELQRRLDLLRAADSLDRATDPVTNDLPCVAVDPTGERQLAPLAVTDLAIDEAIDAATGESDADDRTDRRQLLRRAGAATAGVIAGGVALAATATPAAAANGDNMRVGVANTATATTVLNGKLSVALTDPGFAVLATSSDTDGVGVYGYATGTDGIGVRGNSLFGTPLRISNGGQTIPPGFGNWQTGSFLVVNDQLYYCYGAGAGPASKWARLSGTFVPYDGAVRAYDSRPGTVPATPQKTRFANHEERTLNLTVNNAIPAGVLPSAVVVNLTATNTNPGGFFSAWRSTVPWPGTSSVNWGSANQTIANQSVIKVNGATQIKVRCEGAGGADLVVDVVGYYL